MPFPWKGHIQRVKCRKNIKKIVIFLMAMPLGGGGGWNNGLVIKKENYFFIFKKKLRLPLSSKGEGVVCIAF